MSWWADKINGQNPTPPAPQAIPPMYPQQHQAPVQQPQPGHQPIPQGQEVTAGEAINHWRGGPAQKEDIGPCPGCSSGNYFSRKAPGARMAPMPTCFDCGYPNEQFGSKTGTGGSMQATQQGKLGPTRESRQPGSFQTGAHLNEVVARVN